ncbi:MAG: hypothetical protein U1C74_10765 [Phenylobacterium sp.]|nr:hypothetical protein [Phenylobacterium sp.]
MTAGSTSTSFALDLSKVRVLDGKCHRDSHLAQGPKGSDLRKRQSAFFCDSMVVTFNGPAVLIQFSEKRSRHQSPIGFSGGFDSDDYMTLERVYLNSGKPLRPRDGGCKLFFRKPAAQSSLSDLTGIVCVGVVDEGDWRTVPLVRFDVTSIGER